MLWLQTKTSHDLNEFHITSEFDNRAPDDLKDFSCVVTYRTGAGRRLYMVTSAL